MRRTTATSGGLSERPTRTTQRQLHSTRALCWRVSRELDGRYTVRWRGQFRDFFEFRPGEQTTPFYKPLGPRAPACLFKAASSIPSKCFTEAAKTPFQACSAHASAYF
jgi:hypothetical protein